jgi:hypothetical protein
MGGVNRAWLLACRAAPPNVGIESSNMALSPTDPASARSLWLQLRNTKLKRRLPWRSDWTPVLILLLILSVIGIFYVMMPSNDAVERAEQAAQEETVLRERPTQGTLRDP